MTFKPHQRVSVRYVYVGKDIFLLLPTGFGKSLCYEVLPFVFDVMQCSVTLHSLTAEVHQVLRCSLQLSHALCANVLWQTSFSVTATSSRSVNQEASFCAEAACLVGIAAQHTQHKQAAQNAISVVSHVSHCTHPLNF